MVSSDSVSDGPVGRAGPRRRQARYWIGTIPHANFTPYPVPGVAFLRGQLEEGESTGYLHWQILAYFARKCSLSHLRELFGPCHFEPTRSKSAEDYVWKEATRIDGTQFEFGERPTKLNSRTDWDAIWDHALRRKILRIPANIRVRCYSTLRRIGEDYMETTGFQRHCYVLWGPTGTGKSHRAWDEAGMDAYSKDPRTKFWCGYRGQQNVVVDEFRGVIDIANILRWTDRYPVSVETKGGAVPLLAENFWFTSNLDPQFWWPELDQATYQAFLRRVVVEYLGERYVLES